MAFSVDSHFAVPVPIGVVDTGKTVASGTTRPTIPLGTIVRGVDPTYGYGEFIFLSGVASTAVGTVVSYDGTTFATARTTTVANQSRPVAIAMAACATSTNYAFYQISGTAVVSKSTTAAFSGTTKVSVGIKSTGKIGATASGKEVLGMKTAQTASVTSATTTVACVINRPHLQGRVT